MISNNQAYKLLTTTLIESKDQSERYWELVIACRTKFQPDSYARQREQAHLESAAFYEDKARSCEKALRDLAIMELMRNSVFANQVSFSSLENVDVI